MRPCQMYARCRRTRGYTSPVALTHAGGALTCDAGAPAWVQTCSRWAAGALRTRTRHPNFAKPCTATCTAAQPATLVPGVCREVKEKGYVQFHCELRTAPPPADARALELCRWRDRLWRAGLVGVGADGIGFGNLSRRCGTGRSFLITGTGTGSSAKLLPEQLTEVVSWDIAGNRVTCTGTVVASSETLSHAAVYDCDAAVDAVIHVHHAVMWQRLRDRAPTTDPAAEAGTPAMAFAIQRLISDRSLDSDIIVMGGHPGGLLAFGPSLDQVAHQLLITSHT
jgi:L-ribulose-5-phosphate 4-epimerase